MAGIVSSSSAITAFMTSHLRIQATMRVALYVVLTRPPPFLALGRAMEIATEAGGAVHVDGSSVMVIGPDEEDGYSRGGDVEDKVMFAVYDDLLQEGLLDEEEIQEPQRLSMVGLPILDGGLSPPMDGGLSPPTDGGLSPPPEDGLTAMQVCRLLEEGVCTLGRLQIQSNRAWSGDSAWVGLCAREVLMPGRRVDDVDGHITLFYVGEKELPLLSDMVGDLEAELERMRATPHSMRFEFHCALNAEYAQDDYSWNDILVHSALHGSLHHMVSIATKGRMPKHWLKRAFHFSVRTSRWTRVEER